MANNLEILIIGNGFDLNFGLNTSYTDFISSDIFFDLINKQNGLARYLKDKHHLQNWIDIENELSIYSTNGNLPPEDLNNLLVNFKELKVALVKYLNTVDYNQLKKDSKSDQLLKSIYNKNFIVFNFNYTNTVWNGLESLGVPKNNLKSRVIQVHGGLDDDIIIGVEDQANIRKQHIFLKKAFNKKFKGIDVNDNLMQAKTIHFFGHSLGKTDHTYFQEFFLNISGAVKNSRKEIKLYHYGEEGHTQLLQQIDSMAGGNLTRLKQNNEFELIDTE